RGFSGKARFCRKLDDKRLGSAGFGCHKILKSGPVALSKAGGRWDIPPATPRPWALRVAFSGSIGTEAAPWGVDYSRFGLSKAAQQFIAGWSSPVARQAHNLKVIGSNPIPATKNNPVDQAPTPRLPGFFVG